MQQEVEKYQSFLNGLSKKGLIKGHDVAKIKKLLKERSVSNLPNLLLDLGAVSEIDIADALATTSGKKCLLAKEIPISHELDNSLLRFLREYSIAILYSNEMEIGIAVVDPFDSYIPNALALALQVKVVIHVGVRSEIEKVVLQQSSEQEIEPLVSDKASDDDIEHLRDIASEAPVIRFVNVLFQKAVEVHASDIHVESVDKSLKLRLRIDGVLKDIDPPPVGTAVGIISRIKLLAKMNIAERRLPQDGKIRSQINGKEYDMRISTTPTIHGENVVIRLLDRQQVSLNFEELGFQPKVLSKFLSVLSQPNGVILITGPTGSGKTTTLYTALTHINKPESKIITVEDPVEYEVSGINQIQVKPDIGLDFPNILRSIVRQDPDIIMIGEIRDSETAAIAVQSALTGHLVLSTLHTNDAASGMIRLLDMGVDDFLLASTVTGILAQRLARKLCPHCKTPQVISNELAEKLNLAKILTLQERQFYSAKGCEECSGTGYKGRLVILEFLVVSDKIKQQLSSKATASDLLATALSEGMETMFDDGIRKAAQGLTTLEEVARLTKTTV